MSSRGTVDLRKRSAPSDERQPTLFSAEPKKRISPVRMRRRRMRMIVGAIVLVLFSGLAYGIHFASYLPKYSVAGVDVRGAQTISKNLVKNFVESVIYNGSQHFLSRANIFLFPRGVIEHDLVAEFPRVASAQVSGSSLLANVITVTIEERQPYALWCTQEGTCYQMDKTGFIFALQAAPASSTPASSYIFFGPLASSSDPIGQTFSPGHMPGLSSFLDKLTQAGFSPAGATIESDQDFMVPLNEGYYLHASLGEDADQLVNNLQLTLSSDAIQGKTGELEYVDLRFGDRVYYKLKGEVQQTSASKSSQ